MSMTIRNYSKKIGAALAVAFTMLCVGAWVGVARTQAITNNVPQNKSINGSLYSAGKEVTVRGTVDGDVYCAGESVLIDGTVKGDVLCAAQKLVIKGTVEGSIRAVAQEARIEAKVGRSATIAASSLRLTRDARIGQDATIFASDTIIDGAIGRDATMSGGIMGIGGTIGRNVVYKGSKLIVRDDGRINGTVRYQSDNSIQIGDKAVVGQVTREKQNQKPSGNMAAVIGLMLVAAYIFALMLVLLWPQTIHSINRVAVQNVGKAMLVGIIASVVLPLVAGLLIFTLIGIPIAVFLALIGIGIALLSGPVTAYYLGSMIMSRSKNAVAIMAVGATVLLVVYVVPGIGMVAAMFAYFIGSGTLLLAAKQRIARPNYRVE